MIIKTIRIFFKFLAFGWVTYTLYSFTLFLMMAYNIIYPPNQGFGYSPLLYPLLYLIGWFPIGYYMEWDIGWFSVHYPRWLRISLVSIIFLIPIWLWWRKQTIFRAFLLSVSGSLIGYGRHLAGNLKQWIIEILILATCYLALAALNKLRLKKFPNMNISWLLFWCRPWT